MAIRHPTQHTRPPAAAGRPPAIPVLCLACAMVVGIARPLAQQASGCAGGVIRSSTFEVHDVLGQACAGGPSATSSSASPSFQVTAGLYAAVSFPPAQLQTPWAEATTGGGPLAPPFAQLPIASLASSCIDPEGGAVVLDSFATQSAAGMQVLKDGDFLDYYMSSTFPAGDSFLYTVRSSPVTGDASAESASYPAVIVYRGGTSRISIADQTVPPNTTLSLANYISGNDGPYAFQLVQAPAGMIMDAATGAVSWTPTPGQGPAAYPVVIVARSPSFPSFFDAAIFTVNVPRAPIPGANLTWSAGGVLEWRIDHPGGAAGASPGWDLLNLSGKLTISATPDQKFTIRLVTLAENYSPGPLAAFSGLSTYQWTIASAAGGIQGFDPAKFVLDTSGFRNELKPGFAFNLASDGKNLTLSYQRATTLSVTDDTVTRHSGEMVQILASTLLANDSDPTYPPLTILNASATSAQGAPVENYGSYLYYMPPAGMNLTDTFTYTVRNGRSDTATATVTVKVVPVTSDTPRCTLLITDIPGGGSKRVSLLGTPGHRYELQATTNLLNANWAAILYLDADALGAAIATDPQAPQLPSRFYRAVQRVIVR